MIIEESLRQDYLEAGFGQSLVFGRRPALLVIDFVEAYLAKDSPLCAGVEGARDAAIRLLHCARGAGLPVIHTCVDYEPGGRNGGVFFRKVAALACFERGKHPEWCNFARGLEPVDGETTLLKQCRRSHFGAVVRCFEKF